MERCFNLDNFYHERCGVPLRLSEMGVEHAQLAAVAKQARYDGAALHNKTEITLDVAQEILEAVF